MMSYSNDSESFSFPTSSTTFAMYHPKANRALKNTLILSVIGLIFVDMQIDN